MKKQQTKKLAIAGMMIALAVVGSTFSIQMGIAKCSPVQHFTNVICAVTLGPLYAVLCAFISSLIRNLLGLGTPLAFLGSMIGSLLAGILFSKTKKIYFAVIGEVVGTGIIGAMLCYPFAKFILGNETAALFTFVLPFGISSLVGAGIAFMLIIAIKKTKLLNME